MPYLIIGDHTQGLGITRCLPGRRYQPVIVWDRIISLSRFSRYLHDYRRVKRGTMSGIYNREASAKLLAAIEEIVPEGGQWPVFSVHDDLVHFLHRNRKRLRGRLIIPDNDIPGIIDKYRFAGSLKDLGIDTPDTYRLSDFSEKHLIGPKQFVAKGRLGNRFRNLSNRKGKIIRTSEDIDALINCVGESVSHDEIIIQEKIDNNEKVLSCCGLAIEGKILRSFQYVKLRQYPDQFGTGTFLESIRRPGLIEKASRIVSSFSYTGIFEIEFIETADGRLYVIEMNPRTWKSIHFAALCGQNLCRYYHDYLSKGMVPSEDHSYETGRTWVDIITDLPQSIKQSGMRGLKYKSGTFHCVMDSKDPLPFFMEIVLAPLLALGI